MSVINFLDLKQQIINAINQKHTAKTIITPTPRPLLPKQTTLSGIVKNAIQKPSIKCSSCGHTEITLIDGFIRQPLVSELSGNFVIGGPTLPMVATVCNNCGHMSYYALKILIPNIEL